MKLPLFAIIFFTISSLCLAQNGNDRTYKKAKIYLDNHRILKVNNLEINSANATFLNSVNHEQEKILINTIKLIRIPEGSHMLEGALYGGGTMALTALLIDVQPDPLGIDRKRGAEFYLGLTAGGAALGALVGALFPKWKQVYSEGKFIGQILPINLDLSSQNDQINLKITISI